MQPTLSTYYPLARRVDHSLYALISGGSVDNIISGTSFPRLEMILSDDLLMVSYCPFYGALSKRTIGITAFQPDLFAELTSLTLATRFAFGIILWCRRV